VGFYRGEGGSGTGDVTSTPINIASGGTGASSAASARSNLGVTATGQDTAYAFRSNNLSDLSSASTARTNLGLGTAAVQNTGYFATAAQGALADSATQPGDLATVATTGAYSDLSGTPTLATVATSGSYNDLTNKPTLVSNINDLGDVTITSASNGQVLSYNGTAWVNSSAGAGSVTSVDLTVPTGLSVSGSPITSSGTLAITYATGYAIPTTAKQSNWDTAYGWGNHASAGYLTTETYTGTVTSVSTTVPTGFTVSGSPITSSGTIAISFDTGYALPTTAKQTNWDTAYGWGNHASAGYLTSETYTGTVTSVAASVPTGFTVSGSPVTSSGTLAIAFDTGYALPTTAKQTNWDTAYSWGNHASAGYLTSETYTGTVTSVSATVPTGFTVSGSPITSTGTLAIAFDTGYALPTTAKQTNWDTAYGWGNHASAGYLTSYTETDPVVGAINGLVKANGAGTISAATAGTDYLAPSSTISGGTY
jgi:hypothetical protein